MAACGVYGSKGVFVKYHAGKEIGIFYYQFEIHKFIVLINHTIRKESIT